MTSLPIKLVIFQFANCYCWFPGLSNWSSHHLTILTWDFPGNFPAKILREIMKAAPLEHSNLQPFWYFSQHQPFLEPPQDDASPTCRRRIQWREEVIFGEGKATKHRVTSEETYIYVYHVYIYNSICILYYLLYVAIYIYIKNSD